MLIHDLHAPIQAIATLLENVRNNVAIPARVLDHTESGFLRMKQLLGEIMELYGPDNSNTLSKGIYLDPVKWIPETLAPLALRAESLGLNLHVNVVPDLPPVIDLRDQLDRVLTNLIDNAIKFTPKGGTIRVEADVESGTDVEEGLQFLRISVTDTGRGIPPEKLPYIFDPLRQAQNLGAHKGFPMGLAITQRLVSSHQGQIRVRSQVGVGTALHILLPC